MLITFDQIIVWGIVGLLGGSLAGLLAKGEKRGFGIWKNLGLGLAGALVGGLLPSLEGITISLRDVVSAFFGSILVLVGLWVKGRAASANEP
jgi:uncharacterized membrane protein YeaQ/YmgE (transglycosylase-associated protein family)